MGSSTSQNYEQLGNGNPNGCMAEGLHQQVIGEAAATRTLNRDESGSVLQFDSAAGVVYTLPTPVIGMYFDFITTTTITSNAAKVITADTASEFILGVCEVIGGTTETTLAAIANGSTHVAISSNGTTTGGAIGGRFRLTAISTTQWYIDGYVKGTGTVATPFATS